MALRGPPKRDPHWPTRSAKRSLRRLDGGLHLWCYAARDCRRFSWCWRYRSVDFPGLGRAVLFRVGYLLAPRHKRNAMIYMVEMDFPHPERAAEWHAWYLAHIRVLLSVPGFRASQRFQATLPTPAPYLALHEVASAALFDSAAYRSRGGPASVGEWSALQTNWHRNLLQRIEDAPVRQARAPLAPKGELDETPEVPADAHLLLLRDARDAALPDLPGGIAVSWLHGVGLDRTVAECGLAVVRDTAALSGLARSDPRVCLYRPISEKIRAAG